MLSFLRKLDRPHSPPKIAAIICMVVKLRELSFIVKTRRYKRAGKLVPKVWVDVSAYYAPWKSWVKIM